MSKKYRLKEEYPGSHPIGTISKLDYSKYPKLWEEIVEKVPLFTTKDGVDIFEGDTYYLVSHAFIVSHCSYHSPTDLTYTLFSTKEAADEYVRDNKPEFSRNQILELIDKLKK